MECSKISCNRCQFRYAKQGPVCSVDNPEDVLYSVPLYEVVNSRRLGEICKRHICDDCPINIRVDIGGLIYRDCLIKFLGVLRNVSHGIFAGVNLKLPKSEVELLRLKEVSRRCEESK